MFCENNATFTIVYMFQHVIVYITATVSDSFLCFVAFLIKKKNLFWSTTGKLTQPQNYEQLMKTQMHFHKHPAMRRKNKKN